MAIAPDYGPAHGQLAASLGLMYMASGQDDPAAVARIREVVDRAVELAPKDARIKELVRLAREEPQPNG